MSGALQLEPDHVEEYIDFLVSIGRLNEAAEKLAEAVRAPLC